MKHDIQPPEKELAEYSIDELERWVLRRSRVQDVWAGSIRPRFLSRVIDPHPARPYPKMPWRKLVPGGRWLLIGYPSAVVHVLDLDDTNPAPRVLYDPREFDREPPKQSVDTDYAFWIDRSKPSLSFRVAACIRGEGTEFHSTVF